MDRWRKIALKVARVVTEDQLIDARDSFDHELWMAGSDLDEGADTFEDFSREVAELSFEGSIYLGKALKRVQAALDEADYPLEDQGKVRELERMQGILKKIAGDALKTETRLRDALLNYRMEGQTVARVARQTEKVLKGLQYDPN